jgi:phosphatidylglycerophosphate synthase
VYAAHFAAGLAIKSRIPKAPTWALLVGAFLPDFLWVILANRRIEPTDPRIFFDDWSHSLLMIVLWGILFALPFWKRGSPVMFALWWRCFLTFYLTWQSIQNLSPCIRIRRLT